MTEGHAKHRENTAPDAATTRIPKTLPTHAAAQALGRSPYTLRRWSADGSGPIQPVRVHGRLLWRAADIERLLNGEA